MAVATGLAGALVPLVVNVLQHPLPKPMRCYKLGKAIGKAVESYPEDLKVAMVGTGGLSHQMIGERAGYNDEKWDASSSTSSTATPSAWRG